MSMEVVRPACSRCTEPFGPGERMRELPMEEVVGRDEVTVVRRWVHDWDCAPEPVDQTGWAQADLDRWRAAGGAPR